MCLIECAMWICCISLIVAGSYFLLFLFAALHVFDGRPGRVIVRRSCVLVFGDWWRLFFHRLFQCVFSPLFLVSFHSSHSFGFSIALNWINMGCPSHTRNKIKTSSSSHHSMQKTEKFPFRHIKYMTLRLYLLFKMGLILINFEFYMKSIWRHFVLWTRGRRSRRRRRQWRGRRCGMQNETFRNDNANK